MELINKEKIYKIFIDNYKNKYGNNNNYFATDLILYCFYNYYNYLPSEIRDGWSEHFLQERGEELLSFYINIPFCRNKCAYCFNETVVESSEFVINEYVDNLIEELNYFRDIFKDKKFTNLYIGGGTPSIMSEENMDRLFSSLFSNYNFKENSDLTIEFNPASSSLEKMRVLQKYNFSKVSFGVQSFDQGVLQENNRIMQNYNNVYEAVRAAKNSGILCNVDLILGLYGDSDDKFLDSFKKAADLKPSTISVYSMQPNNYYINRYWAGDEIAFNKYMDEMRPRLLTKIKNYLQGSEFSFPNISLENQRSCNSWVFKKRGLQDKKNEYTFDSLLQKSSVFGVGKNSLSRIFSASRYRQKEVFNKKEEIFSKMNINKRIEMIYYIISVFSDRDVVFFEDFKGRFGEELLNVFGDSIGFLKKRKKIFIEKEKITLIPESTKERMISFLFFFKHEEIISFLNQDKFIKNNLLRIFVDKKKYDFKIKFNNSGTKRIYLLEALDFEIKSSNNKIKSIHEKISHILDISSNGFPNKGFYNIEKLEDEVPEKIRENLYKNILANAGIIFEELGYRFNLAIK